MRRDQRLVSPLVFYPDSPHAMSVKETGVHGVLFQDIPPPGTNSHAEYVGKIGIIPFSPLTITNYSSLALTITAFDC